MGDIFEMKEIYKLKDAELFLMKENRLLKTTFFENYQEDMIVKLIREAILDEVFIQESKICVIFDSKQLTKEEHMFFGYLIKLQDSFFPELIIFFFLD